jgi:hypothetical protein
MELFGIKPEGLAVVTSTFLGPIFAVLATRYLDDRRSRRQRQRSIFDTLMLTRRAGLSPEHVRALNQIEIEFADDKQVMTAFHAYFDHLNEPFPPPAQINLTEKFLARRRRLFADMVKLIGQRHNFKFDRMDLTEGGYYPIGWQTEENINKENSRLLNAILQGQRPLWIANKAPNMAPAPISESGEITINGVSVKNPFPPPPDA